MCLGFLFVLEGAALRPNHVCFTSAQRGKHCRRFKQCVFGVRNRSKVVYAPNLGTGVCVSGCIFSTELTPGCTPTHLGFMSAQRGTCPRGLKHCVFGVRNRSQVAYTPNLGTGVCVSGCILKVGASPGHFEHTILHGAEGSMVTLLGPWRRQALPLHPTDPITPISGCVSMLCVVGLAHFGRETSAPSRCELPGATGRTEGPSTPCWAPGGPRPSVPTQQTRSHPSVGVF